jgi:hypothetical protein
VSPVDRILSDALELALEDRARVAAALLFSLDEVEDENAEREWAEEIERRAERVLAGEANGTPWREVRDRLIERLRNR